MTAKHRSITLVFGLILIILGAALMIVPAGAWEVWTGTGLSSIGTTQYDGTLLMRLYKQDGTEVQRVGWICGSKNPENWQSYQSADATNGLCYQKNLVGSTLDPWSVYDLGTLPPNTMIYAAGTLNRNTASGTTLGAAIGGVQIDVSWYPAVLQTSSGFNVYQLATKVTGTDGRFQTSPFPVPSQANNQNIVIFAEVEKGTAYDVWVGCETTNKGLCFLQSEHYKIRVGAVEGTALNIWVGSGCTYSQAGYPATSSTCTLVYQDGSDVISPAELSVTLPFKIVAVANKGAEPSAIYVHSKSYPLGQPSPPYEVSSFPAPMGSSVSVTRPDGQTRKLYILYVGNTGCTIGGNPSSGGCDVQLPPGRYDILFTTSIDYPWALSVVNVLAIINIGSTGGVIDTSTWTWPSITLTQWVGGIFALFGVGMVGVAIVPRKKP
jgi:hypothetical protein